MAGPASSLAHALPIASVASTKATFSKKRDMPSP